MTAYTSPADPTDVVGKRIGAWIIDLIIYIIFAVALTAVTGGVEIRSGDRPNEVSAELFCDDWRAQNDGFCSFTENTDGTYDITTIEGGTGGLVQWLGHLVAYSVIQGLLGGSLGKLALGLRVVDEQGKVVGIGRSFVRTIAWIGDAITCGLPIVGGVMMVSNKGHRRLGDMIAGTYVVKKESVGRPVVVGPGQAAAGPWAPPTTGGQWGGTAPGAWGTPPPGPVGPSTGSPWTPGAGSPVSGPPVGGPPFGAPAPSSSGDGPTWDPARNAYIQFDRERGAWLQWDDDLKVWAPISQ
ncbi:MAG: RDD family protein [Acidimicrobiales bacterium]|nr:RDD family protein [Acidimicrobiales bacterium]